MDELIDDIFGFSLRTPVLKIANKAITFSNLFYALLIIFATYFFYLMVKLFINIQIKRKKIRSSQGKMLLQLCGYIITLVGAFSTVSALGYTWTYLLFGSTALLVGLGFGLQQLFLDVVSGFIMLLDKDINLGDVVVVDIPSGRESMHGKIYHIGLRATLLQTIDNEFMVIPNSKFLSSGVRSLMRDKLPARFRVNIQIAFDSDMELVKKLMIETVLANPNVSHNPEPTVIIRDFRDSGVFMEVRFWMNEIFNSEIILSEIRFALLENFRENNIQIPYPHHVWLAGNPVFKNESSLRE